MADYSSFKNANGDDLVLQDSRVDTISEKVSGIETGAEVNTIESISINNTELVPDENKNVNIITNGGLKYDEGILQVNVGTGGLYVNDDQLEISFKLPLYKDGKDIQLGYDNTLELDDNDNLSVANPVPYTTDAHDGDVLTFNGNSDEIVWAAPQGGSLPPYTQAEAGKVLTVKQEGDGVEWTTPQAGINFSDIMSWSNEDHNTVANFISSQGGSGGGDVGFEFWKSGELNIWKLTPYVLCNYTRYYGEPIGSGEMPA